MNPQGPRAIQESDRSHHAGWGHSEGCPVLNEPAGSRPRGAAVPRGSWERAGGSRTLLEASPGGDCEELRCHLRTLSDRDPASLWILHLLLEHRPRCGPTRERSPRSGAHTAPSVRTPPPPPPGAPRTQRPRVHAERRGENRPRAEVPARTLRSREPQPAGRLRCPSRGVVVTCQGHAGRGRPPPPSRETGGAT